MKQGTKTVLFGCHSCIHSFMILIAWIKVYKQFPKFWELICIFIHDIGHIGLDYLDDPEQKKVHWRLGAHIANKLFGKKGYDLVAGHASSSGYPISKLRRPDKYSWVVAPNIWLWINCWVEPELIRPGLSRWESGKFWKERMRKFMDSDEYYIKSAHQLYLESMNRG
jgi:hypothetical protein